MSKKHNDPKPYSGPKKAGRNSKNGGRNRHAGRKKALRTVQNLKPITELAREDKRRQSAMSSQDAQAFRRRQVKLAYKMLGFEKNSLREKVALLVFEAFVELELGNDSFEDRFTAAETKMQVQLSLDELQKKNDINVGIQASKVMLRKAYRKVKGSSLTQTKELVAA